MEVRCGCAGDRRLGLLPEPWQLAGQIVDEHVAHVVGETLLDDDAQRCQVRAVCRKGVRRHEPATFAQCVRDVEDAEVVDLRLSA